MHYVGIDLHKGFLVAAWENECGAVGKPVRLECRDVAGVRSYFASLQPFVCVIEASTCYRWLYEFLRPLGEVKLAHPLRLRAIVAGRAKTDKLDAALLAKLLRADLVPLAYIPPRSYHELRQIARGRARISRRMTEAKNELHALLMQTNAYPPSRILDTRMALTWLRSTRLGGAVDFLKEELLERIEHFKVQLRLWDETLQKLRDDFPQVEALLDIPGMGLFSALLVVGEIGEPGRFRHARQVGAYAGLTARVNQSGEQCRHGSISRQGSAWLRWILVPAAMKAVRKDLRLRNFYTRIRKRSSAKKARVAAARKLAGICWLRLRRWEAAASGEVAA
jgi:transposase